MRAPYSIQTKVVVAVLGIAVGTFIIRCFSQRLKVKNGVIKQHENWIMLSGSGFDEQIRFNPNRNHRELADKARSFKHRLDFAIETSTFLSKDIRNMIFDYAVTRCPGFRPKGNRTHSMFYLCAPACDHIFWVLNPFWDTFEEVSRNYGCDYALLGFEQHQKQIHTAYSEAYSKANRI